MMASGDRRRPDSSIRPRRGSGLIRGSARRARRGLTLLELVLALGLSAMVLYSISIAVHLHLHTLNARRSDLEEAQLARAVLRLIADDLRGAVWHEPADYSALQQLAPAAGGGQASGDQAAGGQSGGGQSGEDAGAATVLGGDAGAASVQAASTAGEASTEVASAETLPPRPGLYGNQYELQVDVSRLPRRDQYYALLDPENPAALTDVPSDVKSVAYYLQSDLTGNALGVAGSVVQGIAAVGADWQFGLVRRELDRAATLWALENGALDGLAGRGEVIAPEVIQLEFRYYDGVDWLTEWDSDERGGLPLAIDVIVGIRNSQDVAAMNPAQTGYGESSGALLYHRVISIPTARLPGAEQTAGLEDMGL